jgi:hypothetical protein
VNARLRLAVWPLVVVAIALAAYVLLRHKRTELVDFEVYRTAAVRALAAEPLYRPEDGHYQYKYLPAFALAMAPAAWTTPFVAETTWFTLSVGLLALFFFLSIRALPDPRLSTRVLAWLAVILTGKFWVKELAFGQTNLLLGLLLIGAVIAAQRRQPQIAGVLVGLAVFVKPYALVLVPWLVWSEGLQALAVCAAVLVGGLLLPAVVYGWTGNLALIAGWYRTVSDTTAPNLLLPENMSIATMWAKWIGPGTAASVLAGATVVALVALTAAVAVRRRRVREPNYLEGALLAVLVPLLSPQGWDYVLLLAAPAYICLVDRWQEQSWPWRGAAALGIALTSFSIFDVMGRALYTYLMTISSVSIGALVLVGCLADLRWRELA